MQTTEVVVAKRREDALLGSLGPDIVAALRDPTVVEVMLNPDGVVWTDSHGVGRRAIGELGVEDARNAILFVADLMGDSASEKEPSVAGTLPSGDRFQGVLPPIAARPSFTIRRRAVRIFSLDSYVDGGSISHDQLRVLRQAVENRKNILVVGGTGSGKTTLCNALLAEPAFQQDRVCIIEDTQELQCSAEDSFPLLASRAEPTVTTRDLLKIALRMRPDRIVVGEVRGGEALDLLKAWNTGHPGGLSTLHADSAMLALQRIEGLVGEVSVRIDHAAIAAAIDTIVFVSRTPSGRAVREILNVTGYNKKESQYVVERVA